MRTAPEQDLARRPPDRGRAHGDTRPRAANGRPARPPYLGSGASIPTLLLVACGTLGGVAFTAVYLAEGAFRSGYDAVSQPISALSLGPGG